MKKFAIMAILAMFCMAGIVSAQTPVQGTVKGSYDIAKPAATVSWATGTLDPLATQPVVGPKIDISGNANYPVSVTATSTGLFLGTQRLTNLILIDGAPGTKTKPVVGAPGAVTVSFQLAQTVVWADASGDYSGSVDISFA